MAKPHLNFIPHPLSAGPSTLRSRRLPGVGRRFPVGRRRGETPVDSAAGPAEDAAGPSQWGSHAHINTGDMSGSNPPTARLTPRSSAARLCFRRLASVDDGRSTPVPILSELSAALCGQSLSQSTYTHATHHPFPPHHSPFLPLFPLTRRISGGPVRVSLCSPTGDRIASTGPVRSPRGRQRYMYRRARTRRPVFVPEHGRMGWLKTRFEGGEPPPPSNFPPSNFATISPHRRFAPTMTHLWLCVACLRGKFVPRNVLCS